jgi:hypothetical protein
VSQLRERFRLLHRASPATDAAQNDVLHPPGGIDAIHDSIHRMPRGIRANEWRQFRVHVPRNVVADSPNRQSLHEHPTRRIHEHADHLLLRTMKEQRQYLCPLAKYLAVILLVPSD